MSLLKKSLIVATILVVYIAVFVFAAGKNGGTDPFSGNNVCDKSKKELFNGTQNPNGECVTTVMGEIPSKDKMVSTVILFPQDNTVLKPFQKFTIITKSINLKTGFFDDPVKQYYLFPQTLDKNGFIQGHSHVTIQKIINRNVPLDPEKFDFFKGLNDPANGKGELNAVVEKGLPAGKYRLCTMVSSFAHQPTLMPVAQRGAQDDCVRFTVK